ncbi:protein kinase [Actibacterium sp.]|uniref:protein kinase domain-containing protein n=1 Tax=Actibacterium sp. TaxID=1872125 RepID=UPI0035681A18
MPKDSRSQTGLTVSIGQYSAAGRKPGNQDFHGALVPTGTALTLKGVVIAIADGISSSPVSREAAETVVKSLMTDYYCTSDAWTVKTAASRVISATNSWIYAQNMRAGIGDMDRGRVTTLSALILKGRAGHLFHVGDSRIWRVAGDSLEPLTQDHRVTLSSVESYLGRAMGAERAVEIDYRKIDLVPGDVFLLTTDGVHDHMDPRFVTAQVRGGDDLDTVAQRIAEQAFQQGSTDNLTVQILRVETLADAKAADLLEAALALPAPQPPNAGDEIDGFRIQRALHSNARSHIYRATAPDGQAVALKIPSVDLRDDPEYLRRFLMEEWIARRLNSAHVLKAAPAPETRTALYVLTEYVEGQTLRQWMTDNPNPDLETWRNMIDQIIRGLRVFHRREMLHQDLRPENIMIDRHGTVKIIDFGSTSVAGVQEAAPAVTDDDILGTLQYTAPEYFTGDPASPRSDQFSLGVIAYEMLTGRLPYGAKVSRIRSRRDQRALRYRPARNDKNAVPDWLDEALERAVNPEPERRYPVLSEFSAAIRAPGASYKARHKRPLAERNPVGFWQSVSAALALVVVVLLVLLVRQGGG